MVLPPSLLNLEALAPIIIDFSRFVETTGFVVLLLIRFCAGAVASNDPSSFTTWPCEIK